MLKRIVYEVVFAAATCIVGALIRRAMARYEQRYHYPEPIGERFVEVPFFVVGVSDTRKPKADAWN